MVCRWRQRTTGFVDSFDNYIFNVWIGKVDKSELMGTISAMSIDELNEKTFNFISEFQEKTA